jgi:uncharacterized protein
MKESMQINVAQLLKQPIGAEQSYEIKGDINLVEERDSYIQGKASLIRTNRGVLVRGDFESDVELTCSRCLSLFYCPIKFQLNEEFLPSLNIMSGLRQKLDEWEDASNFVIDGHHILDLSEAVRQYALLAIPMKPICRQDCAGLCPYCGANLNQGPCQCQSKSLAET